ncbi:hypothetical protein PQE68_gp141 [Bacillus phage vB_BanS_Sophrita]|uniref:Uncharacterized protein n=1 Tax=Bacillus phage vB_BanS_Sophrita TaxID=2894790 RepID=A0AAE9CEA8_9CAUD|nr:hypothetical protein PQE68_gp141 [Bacillus phage vB_BanS_Sophrita]UGO50732.1 hypothetical protein SOPHRITA_141 [Bacillus phage vB_BanS_Sophrita]
MSTVESFQFRIARKHLPEETGNDVRTIFTAELLENGKWRVSFTSRKTQELITHDYPERNLLKALADRDWILVDDGDEE